MGHHLLFAARIQGMALDDAGLNHEASVGGAATLSGLLEISGPSLPIAFHQDHNLADPIDGSPPYKKNCPHEINGKWIQTGLKAKISKPTDEQNKNPSPRQSHLPWQLYP